MERAGIKVDKYFASEINANAVKVAIHNYPNTIQLGNVLDLQEDELKKLPKIDLLIGGSPCQGISRAKSNRDNLRDPRSKLFYEYIRIRDWILKHNNPDIKYLLENVIPDKETLDIMNNEIGFKPIEINSVIFSAQRRRRLYWTNINIQELPQGKNIKIKDIIYDNAYKMKKIEKQLYVDTLKYSKNYVRWDTSGKEYYSQANRAYYINGTMCTVPKARASSKLNIWLGDNTYRRIHPIEAERLQTLPDNYTKIVETNNDDNRVGLVGDGWTVDVIAHIFKSLIKNT